MKGRVFIQRGNESGWIAKASGNGEPRAFAEVCITPDLEKSCVFDVDNPAGYSIIENYLLRGYVAIVADSFIHRTPPKPSASPFTPII